MSNFAAVVLCAGKGTRMNDDSKNKVCFSVNGVPAVKRNIENMMKAGIDRFVVVVGHLAQTVMDTLSCYDNIAYAYQSEQTGTGSAALMGLSVLDSLGYKGAALICMGDKIISESVISKLISKYQTSDSNTVFAVQPKEFNPSGGRILLKDDKVCGIYEQTDSYILKLGALNEQTEDAYIKALSDADINDKKKAKVLNYALNNEISDKVTLCGESFMHEDIEATPYVNTATYLCDVQDTVKAIKELGSNNAQGEIYLTDAINILVEHGGAEIIPISFKEDMLTFATQDELKEVSGYFASIERK